MSIRCLIRQGTFILLDWWIDNEVKLTKTSTLENIKTNSKILYNKITKLILV